MKGPISETENTMGKRGFGVREHPNQAIAVEVSGRRKGKALKIKGSKILGVMKGVYIRVQRVFDDLLKPEIEILCGIVVYLQTAGKLTGNKDEVLRWMGFRVKPSIRKAVRRLETLADKGYLLRVRSNVGSLDRRGYGFALSERGHQVILAIDREYDKAAEWSMRVERLGDVVLYLDQAHKMLRKTQEILITPELTERLRSLKV